MAEQQQFKPARPFIEQFLLDKDKVGIFKALNPNLKNDPCKKKVLNALDFITPDIDDPLSVLGGGGKVAAFFSNLPLPLARKIKATRRKNVIEDLELKVKRERAC